MNAHHRCCVALCLAECIGQCLYWSYDSVQVIMRNICVVTCSLVRQSRSHMCTILPKLQIIACCSLYNFRFKYQQLLSSQFYNYSGLDTVCLQRSIIPLYMFYSITFMYSSFFSLIDTGKPSVSIDYVPRTPRMTVLISNELALVYMFLIFLYIIFVEIIPLKYARFSIILFMAGPASTDL